MSSSDGPTSNFGLEFQQETLPGAHSPQDNPHPHPTPLPWRPTCPSQRLSREFQYLHPQDVIGRDLLHLLLHVLHQFGLQLHQDPAPVRHPLALWDRPGTGVRIPEFPSRGLLFPGSFTAERAKNSSRCFQGGILGAERDREALAGIAGSRKGSAGS